MEKLLSSGVLFVHFPENGHHGCEKHCTFCLFDRLDYNLPCKPTDEEILTFLERIEPDGIIQICGAGDPLFNFNKNKDYLLHIIELIHSTGRPAQLVTKYTEVVAEYMSTDLAPVDMYVLSVEDEDAAIKNIIVDLLELGKEVRITKIANFGLDIINEINWEALESYVDFYHLEEPNDNFHICFRPNFDFDYPDDVIKKLRKQIKNLGGPYRCYTYMHQQSKYITLEQLWNGRYIACCDTRHQTYDDMHIPYPNEDSDSEY